MSDIFDALKNSVMVNISDAIYAEFAEKIVGRLPECGIINEVFVQTNIEMNIVLRLTLGAVVGIDNIRPIYWECWSECDGVEVNNNFSWSELEPFVNSKRLK